MESIDFSKNVFIKMSTQCLNILMVEMGGWQHQAWGGALMKTRAVITGQPPSEPHNKIMLSGPTGIWFQCRG